MASDGYRRPVDQVGLLGALVGLAALLLPFLVVRPNRVAAGVPHGLFDALPPLAGAAYLLLFVAAGMLAFGGERSDRARALGLGLAGSAAMGFVLAAGGAGAARLLTGLAAYARVSLAAGSWLAILGGYILVLAALRRLSGLPKAVVAAAAPVLLVVLAAIGAMHGLSLARELAVRRSQFLDQLGSHIALSAAATGIAVAVGVPLGIWAYRREGAGRSIFVVVDTLQTIPSLAMFGLLIAPLAALAAAVPALRAAGVEGIGATPALIALSLYALLPIVRNTYTGLKVVDPAALEAGLGMGMGKRHLFGSVQVPLALPILLAGMRTSLVQAIGNTTVAALIGAGGFGVFIFEGLGQAAPDLILLGTLPVIVLALAVDRAAAAGIRLATPRGMRRPAGAGA